MGRDQQAPFPRFAAVPIVRINGRAFSVMCIIGCSESMKGETKFSPLGKGS